MSTPLNQDLPLPYGLTPAEIISAVFFDAFETGAENASSINTADFDILYSVDNARIGCATVVGFSESFTRIDDDPDTEESIHTYVCEIKIGNAYVFGRWEINRSLAGASEAAWALKAAENAYMRAAMLIGRRVERQPVSTD